MPLNLDKALISSIVYWVKYPFKLWLYELIDLWVIARYAHIPQKRLLIFRLDLIGDYLMCRPFFQTLRQNPEWTDLECVFAGNQLYKSLAEWMDGATFDSYFWIDRARFINSVGYRFSVLKQVRLAGFEIVIHPSHTRQYWPESLVRVSGAARKIAPENVGKYMNTWELALTSSRYSQIVKTGPAGIFEFYRNRIFFSALFQKANEIEQLRIDLPEPEPKGYAIEGAYFVLAPGASTKNRRWPIEKFATLASDIAHKKGWKIVVMGSTAEAELGEALQSLLPQSEVLNLAGKLTLPQSMALLKESELLISNESAPVHMAATTGTPAICISQGNHFGRWNPYPAAVAGWIKTAYPAAFGNTADRFEELVIRFHDGSDWPVEDVEVGMERFEKPRVGWGETFKSIHEKGYDSALIPDVFEDENSEE